MTLAQYERLPESERAWWVAEHEIESGACPQCGGDRATCSDPQQPWYPQRTVCYSTMAQKALEAKWDAKHKDHEFHDGTFLNFGAKRSDMFPFHVNEGVSLWVAPDDLDPDGDWL